MPPARLSFSKMKIRALSAVILLTVSLANSQVPKNINLLSSLQFPGQTLAGCWHYERGGRIYGLLGASQGIIFVDLTNPSSPQLLFQLPGVNNLWHEVKVQGDYAYAVCEGVDSLGVMNGVQIMDLRYLPDSVPYRFYQGDGLIMGQLITGHSITTQGNYIFVNGHNISSLGRGVLICDISNPMFPVFTGAVTQNYCHDSYARGNFLYTSDIYAGQFSVYDITDKTTPVLLATQATPGHFNHNTWLSDDGRTIYTTDEQSNQPLGSFDISNLNNITLLDVYYTIHMPTHEVHNVRVINDYLINPSYGSQLTLVDAARPGNLVEIGNYPTGNSLCWDADPYLSTGAILATDMNSSTMYLFDPVFVRACYLEGNITDSLTGIPVTGCSVKILIPDTATANSGAGFYATGTADPGSYSVLFEKTGYFPKTISGVSLFSGIVTNLDVALVPLSNGISTGNGGSIAVFPLQTQGILSVRAEKSAILNLEVFDTMGRMVLNSPTPVSSGETTQLNLSVLASGYYFLKISSVNTVTIQKIEKL